MRNLHAIFFAMLVAVFISATNSAAQNRNITYHGGATMPTPINVYLIWYGQWDVMNPPKNPTQVLLSQLVSDLGNSNYAHINDTYSGNPGSSVFNLMGSTVDAYSHGHGILTEQTIYDIVMTNAQQNNWLPLPPRAPYDPTTVFFVLTSAELPAPTVSPNGSSSQVQTFGNPGNTGMCGWHASVRYFQNHNHPHFPLTLSNLLFGFVGDPEGAPRCAPYFRAHDDAIDPNPDPLPHNLTPPNPSGDMMANHLAHELMEAANDPDGEAWYSTIGESADNCSFNLGPNLTRPENNSNYNLQIPASGPSATSHYYLVQQEWVNINAGSNGYCAMTSLQPASPIFPSDGLQDVAANFPVRWNDGLDGAPPDPMNPLTYAIYYKYWPYGSDEPGSYTLVVGAQPCNPDSPGVCSTFVQNMPNGNYRWYAVANLAINGSVIPSPQSSPAFFTVGFQPISTIPRPLPPTPLYPYDGTQSLVANFPVYWSDGLDAVRRRLSWPVTYAIYYKYWPYGGNEPGSYTLVVGAQPCNSVSQGVCGTSVQNMPDGNYRWFVVANMDVSSSTGVPNSIVSTQSSVAFFTVGQPVQAVYQGCFTDDANRALPVQLFTDGSTVEGCTQAAFSAGYRFAGLQYYGQCFAGNITAYAAAPEEECNTPCNANPNQMCGGSWRNSIWSTGR